MSRARIAPLAKLPIFYDLAGRKVVVVGGTPAAAWKAELLAAAGATVDVFAEAPGAEILALSCGAPAAGSVRVLRRPWAASDFGGAALAVADAKCDRDAEWIAAAARNAGVPVNVIDRPAFGDFQFGVIVNRSPVVVGVSTDGAAPVLGQAIRRRIEAILPPQLGLWAEAVKQLRRSIGERIHDAGRRWFWERFSDRAFAAAAGPSDGELDVMIEAAMAQCPGAGKVTLVSAGPGDAEHLTLKAVRTLQAADVILFDDVVPDEVVELSRREARRLRVGGGGRRPLCCEDDIAALMIELARQGKRVVRLKSGDPLILRRGANEIIELTAAGIAVDVVPGVMSADARCTVSGRRPARRNPTPSRTSRTSIARDRPRVPRSGS